MQVMMTMLLMMFNKAGSIVLAASENKTLIACGSSIDELSRSSNLYAGIGRSLAVSMG